MGLGLKVLGLGLRVDLGLRVSGVGLGVLGILQVCAGFRVCCSFVFAT